MKKEEELLESMRKLNNRLTLLEDCVRMIEQRVVGVEDMNRLNERKISRSMQELNTYGLDIKDMKVILDGFLAGIGPKSDRDPRRE